MNDKEKIQRDKRKLCIIVCNLSTLNDLSSISEFPSMSKIPVLKLIVGFLLSIDS